MANGDGRGAASKRESTRVTALRSSRRRTRWGAHRREGCGVGGADGVAARRREGEVAPGAPRHASTHAPAPSVLGDRRRRQGQREGNNGAVKAREKREGYGEEARAL
uniref:DUF834 domain-containing protein n=1 Tax=Oryza glaberrima TaxID=4538 RepID=A0A679BDT4_ORYGL|nr:hypothetical protein [Oryza glaberrima]BBF89607.1 hypothetical protein [Oryza glaberrima]